MTQDASSRELDGKQCIAEANMLPADMTRAAIDAWKKQEKSCPGLLKYEFAETGLKPLPPNADLTKAYEKLATVAVASAESLISDTANKLGVDGKVDLGAKALRNLMISEISLTKIRDQVTDKATISALSSRIDADKQAIFGKHDIAGAEAALAKQIGQDSYAVDHLDLTLAHSLDANLATAKPDPKFIAKLARDLAVVEEAIVSNTADPVDAQILLGKPGDPHGIKALLDLATKNDPTNPDLAELRTIDASLEKKFAQ
jgi:hypothetical protein